MLRANVDNLGLGYRAHAHELAFSNRSGDGELNVPQSSTGFASSLEAVSKDLGHTYSLPIQLTTIDSFVSSNAITDLRFIKIDTEYHDLHVLEGAEEVLNTMRPLVLSETQPTRQHLVRNWMAQRGYVQWAWLSHEEQMYSDDVLFIPAELRKVHLNWYFDEHRVAFATVLITGMNANELKFATTAVSVRASTSTEFRLSHHFQGAGATLLDRRSIAAQSPLDRRSIATQLSLDRCSIATPKHHQSLLGHRAFATLLPPFRRPFAARSPIGHRSVTLSIPSWFAGAQSTRRLLVMLSSLRAEVFIGDQVVLTGEHSEGCAAEFR